MKNHVRRSSGSPCIGCHSSSPRRRRVNRRAGGIQIRHQRIVSDFTPTISATDAKLRIALMTGNFGYIHDGVSHTLNHLVDNLESTGNQVSVYAPLAEGCKRRPNVSLVSVPSVAIPGRAEYHFALGLPGPQRKKLFEFAPDVVHVATPDMLGFAALRFARKFQIPVVASLHTRFETYLEHYRLGWLRPVIEQRIRSFYRQADVVLVPTRDLRDSFVAQGLGRKVRVWSRGVDRTKFNSGHRDQEWRRSLGFHDEDCVVMFFGRLVREKGTDVFIETVEQLRQSGVKFKVLVIGDGPERQRLLKRLPDAAFVGFLNEEDLSRAVASADVLLNPSRSEAFGNVNLEAMAAGVAVVAADEGNSRELIEHNKNGLLSSTGGSDGYVEAVWRLVRDPSLRNRLSAAAQRSSKGYQWKSILDGVTSAYREAIGNRGSADHFSGSQSNQLPLQT